MNDQNGLTVRDDSDASRWEAVDAAGATAGFAAYRRDGSTVVLTHTEVDDAFGGRGVGSLLVRTALDAVRREGLRVDPQCPFVRSWIERHPDYADLTG